MFRSLDLFIAVAEEKSLVRASERLFLSQPALTRQIQALEEELGARLFNRTGRGVELTSAGAAWLKHARSIRNTVDQAIDHVRRVSMGQLGRLDIGMFGSSMFTLVPDILSRFSRIHPGVEMVLHQLPRVQQLECLRQGIHSVSFMPFNLGENDLEFELICQERVVVAVHEDHPLSVLDAIALDALREFVWIGAPESHQTPPQFQELLDLFKPRVTQRSDNVVGALAMVRCNLGFAFVPASLQTLQIPNVVYRPLLTQKEPFWDLYCVYRKNDDTPVLRALLETVRAFRAEGS